MTKPPAQPSVYLLAQETVTTGAAEGCTEWNVPPFLRSLQNK